LRTQAPKNPGGSLARLPAPPCARRIPPPGIPPPARTAAGRTRHAATTPASARAPVHDHEGHPACLEPYPPHDHAADGAFTASRDLGRQWVTCGDQDRQIGAQIPGGSRFCARKSRSSEGTSDARPRRSYANHCTVAGISATAQQPCRPASDATAWRPAEQPPPRSLATAERVATPRPHPVTSMIVRRIRPVSSRIRLTIMSRRRRVRWRRSPACWARSGS
jgi:hypothetical protein